MSPTAQERADHFSKMLRQYETLYVGVVAEDPLVCYVATLRKIEVETADATQLCVVASTIIKEMVVLFLLVCTLSRSRDDLSAIDYAASKYSSAATREP
jgi:hypothetical protein